MFIPVKAEGDAVESLHYNMNQSLQLILSKEEARNARLGMRYTAVCKPVFQRAG